MASLLVVVGVVWVLLPDPETEPRPRAYQDVTACLLTDQQGVFGKEAAPVWAGLQAASEQTHGQVRYLAVTGEQTVTNAQTFAGTLVLSRCTVIVAAPGIADQAIRAVARDQAQQRFLVVGGAAPETANVTRVDLGQVSSAVADRLTAG